MNPRRLILFAILFLLACVPCPDASPADQAAAGSGAAAADPAAQEVSIHALHDWLGWDWRLDRPQLVQAYWARAHQVAEPLREYREAVTYEAGLDSLGLDAFLDLSPEARDHRRREAAAAHAEAMRFQVLIQSVWQGNLEGHAIGQGFATGVPELLDDDEARSLVRPGQNPRDLGPTPDWAGVPGEQEAVTRVLARLVLATGLDPSNPFAWYDLAFFTGAVGDAARSRRALEAARAALAATAPSDGGVDDAAGAPAPAGPAGTASERADLALRIALDLGWLAREAGFPAEALREGARADSLLNERLPAPVAPWREMMMIRALALAESGDVHGARALAQKLDGADVWIRNRWVDESAAGRKSVGAAIIRTSRETRRSDFMRDWVWALSWSLMGDHERAVETLGFLASNRLLELPANLDWRYWNDCGRIYELAGMREEARQCYGLAVIHRPYFLYFPMIGARGLALVHGQPGAGTPYFLGYRHHYLAGSLFSYAANAALAFEVERDPDYRSLLGEAALAGLDACRGRGIRPASALALRGRVRYFGGEPELARVDLERAYQELRDEGHESADICLLLGILLFEGQDYHASLPWLKRFTELAPDAAVGWRALGLACTFAGKPVAAVSAFDRALALVPESGAVWFNRGLVHLREQQWEEARRDLRQAAILLPDQPEVAQVLAVAEDEEIVTVNLKPSRFELRPSRQDSLRIAQLRRGASLEIADELAATGEKETMAWLALDADRLRDLIPRLERAFAKNPTKENRRRLAWALLRAGRADEARRLLAPLWDKGIEVEEMCLLLEADRALGDPGRARALARSLVSTLDPVADARLWSLVTSICLDSDLLAEGGLALDEALRLEPGNETLRGLRSWLK